MPWSEGDGLGRVIGETQTVEGLTPVVVLASQYDANGNRTQLAASLGGTADFVNDYLYDDLGRLASVRQHGVTGSNAAAAKRVDFAYDAARQGDSLKRHTNLAGNRLHLGLPQLADQCRRAGCGGRADDQGHALRLRCEQPAGQEGLRPRRRAGGGSAEHVLGVRRWPACPGVQRLPGHPALRARGADQPQAGGPITPRLDRLGDPSRLLDAAGYLECAYAGSVTCRTHGLLGGQPVTPAVCPVYNERTQVAGDARNRPQLARLYVPGPEPIQLRRVVDPAETTSDALS